MEGWQRGKCEHYAQNEVLLSHYHPSLYLQVLSHTNNVFEMLSIDTIKGNNSMMTGSQADDVSEAMGTNKNNPYHIPPAPTLLLHSPSFHDTKLFTVSTKRLSRGTKLARHCILLTDMIQLNAQVLHWSITTHHLTSFLRPVHTGPMIVD